MVNDYHRDFCVNSGDMFNFNLAIYHKDWWDYNEAVTSPKLHYSENSTKLFKYYIIWTAFTEPRRESEFKFSTVEN